MSEIQIKCVDQNLHFENTPTIYSGDVNNDTVKFDFDETWDGYGKTAIFYRSKDDVYCQLLDDSNKCMIPKEILKSQGNIYIGVFGAKGDVVITSEVIRYRILEGAITEDLNTPDPTPDIFEQVLGYYGYTKDLVDNMISEHDTRIQEAINATKQCTDVVSALQLEYYDMNGGDPFTDTSEYEYDINGGYPV